MPGQYNHTFRTGQVTEAEYNADHDNHVANRIPTSVDDYSQNVSEMRQQTEPGEVGSESQANSLAGELERIRFVIAEMKVKTFWYETSPLDFATGTVLVFIQAAAPSGWTFLSSTADRTLRTATAAVGLATGGSWVISGLTGSSHLHAWTYLATTGTTGAQTTAVGGQSGNPDTHTHQISWSANTGSAAPIATSDGTWRPLYVDAIPCVRTT